METGCLHVDVRHHGGGNHLVEPRRVPGADIAEMVAEHRHVRVPSGDDPQVGLPGRSDGETRDETALPGGGEKRLRLVAQQPAIVALFDVMGETGQFEPIVERSQPARAARRVVGGAPGAVEVGHHVEAARVALSGGSYVLGVVRVGVYRGAYDECLRNPVRVHLVEELVDRSSLVLVRNYRRIGPAAPGMAVAVEERRPERWGHVLNHGVGMSVKLHAWAVPVQLRARRRRLPLDELRLKEDVTVAMQRIDGLRYEQLGRGFSSARTWAVGSR